MTKYQFETLTTDETMLNRVKVACHRATQLATDRQGHVTVMDEKHVRLGTIVFDGRSKRSITNACFSPFDSTAFVAI